MPSSSFRALLSAPLAGALATLLPVLASAATPAAADPTLLDLESRIQYSYYTEDLRALENLAAELATQDSPDGMKSYFGGLADYRLTQLEASRDKTKAHDRGERCASSLDRAVQANKNFADALALQSACLGMLADLTPWRAPLAGSKSRSLMERALRLAPRNPRVLLLDAMGAFERAPNGEDKDRALAKLKKAIVALENERQDLLHVPGWGLADAYAYLGRVCLDKGDTVAARDALEHALLAAPQFEQARRLMTKITSG